MSTNTYLKTALITLAVGVGLAGGAGAALNTIVQTGAAAGAGEHYVAVLLRDSDGGLPAGSYTLFKSDSTPANFASVAGLVPTTNVSALALILQRAEAAGLDNAALERTLDALAGESAPAGSLAEKLSYVLRGSFSDNGRDEQRELLVRVFPQVAMACGAGWIGKVTSAGPTVFELREGAGGGVAARVTSSPTPSLLPAPGGLSAPPVRDPRSHLRVYLNWWTTAALRERTPHICGYNVYRADLATYMAASGAPPPAALTPAQLEADLAAGLITKVNACPVLPDAVYEALPLPDAPHFFTDDNDSDVLSRFDAGGQPFEDGQRLTYYVAACDYFGRPGEPSGGLEVKICDRMPPAPPEGLRAEPVYEGGVHFVRVSFARPPQDEVGRLFVYCYETPQEALPDLRHPAAPATPSLVATIDNDGASARVQFDHTGPGALALPADAGKTRWYCVRAEDRSSCIEDEGFGNISLPCGTVPASLYGFDALPAPDGHLLSMCCDLIVDLLPEPAAVAGGVPLQATRNNPRIRWVEFHEIHHDIDLGRHVFDDSNTVDIVVPVDGLEPPVQFEARFVLDTGQVGEFVPGSISSAVPHGESWRALLRCGELGYHPECEDFPYFPLDPGSGEIMPVCGEFVQQANEHSWRVFRRVGLGGNLSLVASGKFSDTVEWCDPAVPAVAVTICYSGQTFDIDGNPSPLVRLGCRHPSHPESLPVPDIDRAEVLPGADLLAATATARVSWFCPRPGVERFDLAVHPVPPGVSATFSEGDVEWGLIQSPRLPNGYGGAGTRFELDLELSKGTSYVARVRARGTPPIKFPQMMGVGDWSAGTNVLWSPEQDTQGGVLPWPTRAVPAAIPFNWPAAYDQQFPTFEHGIVAIGQIPTDIEVIESSSPTAPATVGAPSLEPFLFKPLPLVVYRHETTAGARGEMAQTSPMIDQFWEPQGGGVIIKTPFIGIRKRPGAKPADPYYIWVRDFHPMAAGRSYRYTVTCFGGDGEPVGSVVSAAFTPSN